MDQILFLRERIIRFYKQYETIINFILKFILGLLVFGIINGIGCYGEAFEPLFTSPLAFPFFILIALLFTILPPTLANALVGLTVVLQISESMEIAAFVLLAFILITVFYTRLSPRKSYLILAVVLGYYFNMQYAVVIFAGLYCGLISIIPVTIGVFIWSSIPNLKELMQNTSVVSDESDIMGMFTGFLDTYKNIFEKVTGDFEWIFTAFIFAMIIVAVYAVSRLTVDYAKDIAIGVGALVGVLGFIIGTMITKVNYSIIAALIFTVLSAIIVEIIKFFDIVLDYEKSERVQFEDEENYYYVKIIPKIIVDGVESVKSAPPKKKAIPVKKPTPAPVYNLREEEVSRSDEDYGWGDKETPSSAMLKKLLRDEVLTETRTDIKDEIVYKRQYVRAEEPGAKPSARFINEIEKQKPRFASDIKKPTFNKVRNPGDE